jgi:hypothetical protein
MLLLLTYLKPRSCNSNRENCVNFTAIRSIFFFCIETKKQVKADKKSLCFFIAWELPICLCSPYLRWRQSVLIYFFPISAVSNQQPMPLQTSCVTALIVIFQPYDFLEISFNSDNVHQRLHDLIMHLVATQAML